MNTNLNIKNIYKTILESISKFEKSRAQKTIKIDFEAEDLQELDKIQNIVLKVQDGSMSVGYLSDRMIFELCLQIVDRIFRECMVGNTSIDTQTKFEYVQTVHDFMEKYFKNYLDNKLL